MSIFFVYIMETTASNGKMSYYTGYTNNLNKRFKQHRTGKGAKFCRGKGIELKYFETYTDRKKAMHRESEIKTFTRKKKKELIDSLTEA